MINFFRKIRQQLLSQNKVSKYLLYAIGEIALVMVGILLALQVNNWNEQKKERQIEQKLLQALKEEINSNINQIEQGIKLQIGYKKMYVALLEDFANLDRTIDPILLDSLVEGASAPQNIEIQTGVAKSIIATGDIRYLKNDQIVEFVRMFEDKISLINQDFERMTNLYVNQLWPLENHRVRRLNRAHLQYYFFKEELPKSAYKTNWDGFFNDIDLENTYALALYEYTGTIKREENLLNHMNMVLGLVKAELVNP